MRKLLFTITSLFVVLNSVAQTDIFKKKRTYKVEGYILAGTDTVNGIISIPIRYDELDYYSLGTVVEFTDSLNQTKKYRPNKTPGFGLLGDAVFGDYVSIGLRENPDNYLFLKRVLAGAITLYENNLDRTVVKTTPTSVGANSHISQKQSVDESIYYLQKNNEPLIKIQFDSKTSSVKKKDLKKLVNILPESFTNSDEEIDVSAFITILSDYNLKNQKE